MALGMLYNGASGCTRNEIDEVLGITDFSETEINEYYQKISPALLKIDPVRFFADRPFVYLIREKSTGVILFIGRMDEPCE